MSRASHQAALRSPRPGHETAIVRLRAGIRYYCAAHERQFDRPVGSDYVLGPVVLEMIECYRSLLLNGETGRLDCGALDAEMLQLAEDAELDVPK